MIGLSRSGRRLAVATKRPTIQLWDLGRLRAGLRELGLDWDSPPPPPDEADLAPLAVTLDVGELLDRDRYTFILARFPFHAEAYYRRGLAHARFGQGQAALADFGLALALKPDHLDARAERAHLAAAQRDWSLARDDFSAVLSHRPDDWQLWRGRGLAQLRLRRWAEALADLSRALELGPEGDGRAELYEARAHAHQRLGNDVEALAGYRRALQREPENCLFRNNLAWLLATCPAPDCRNPAEAVALARRTVERVQHGGDYWNTLGVALYRTGDAAGAVRALVKSHELFGERELAFNGYFLALAHARLGNREEARRWYERSVRWQEEHRPADEELCRFRAEAAAQVQ
jgi:tetratricopeptide (TPR) repeat protein